MNKRSKEREERRGGKGMEKKKRMERNQKDLRFGVDSAERKGRHI